MVTGKYRFGNRRFFRRHSFAPGVHLFAAVRTRVEWHSTGIRSLPPTEKGEHLTRNGVSSTAWSIPLPVGGLPISTSVVEPRNHEGMQCVGALLRRAS